MRKTYSASLITILVLGILIGILNAEPVKAETQVAGIISSKTTWTQTNSPYSLTGNILVDAEVTLTVEPGVTVHLKDYYIRVDGPLQAQGTKNNQITFTGTGQISFRQTSIDWNQTTQSGSIIEYSNLETIYVGISESSPKISNNLISRMGVGGSALIIHNTITEGITVTSDADSPIISNNIISEKFKVATHTINRSGLLVISNNTINNGLSIGSNAGSVQLLHNTISGEIRSSGTTMISNNVIDGGIVLAGGVPTVTNNTIIGQEIGISLDYVSASILYNSITAKETGIKLAPSYSYSMYGSRSEAYIFGNVIFDCNLAGIHVGEGSVQAGTSGRYNNATIKGNVIRDNYYGIESYASTSIEGNLIINNYFGVSGGNSIKFNTVANNSYGLVRFGNILSYNNILDNSEFNVHFGSSELGFHRPSDVDVSNNWWGTTDSQIIQGLIFDFYDDFDLGKANFSPLLSEFSSGAPTSTFMPIDLVVDFTPSQEPFPITTIALASIVLIAVSGTGILIFFKKYRK